MNRMTKFAVGGVLGFGLALSGCSSDMEEGSATQSPTEPQTGEESSPSQSESPASDSSEDSEGALPADVDLSKTMPKTTAAEAVKIGQNKVKDGTLHAVELDYDSEDGKWEYDVKIKDGNTDHKVVIDAASGEVIRDESEDSDDEEKTIDLKSPLSYDEAYDLAKQKGEGRLTGWKLEYDDGQRQYQFDFDDKGSETEVTVNVESKKVTVD